MKKFCEAAANSGSKGSAGGYGVETRIPLKSLAPGLYVLRVDATMRIGDRPRRPMGSRHQTRTAVVGIHVIEHPQSIGNMKWLIRFMFTPISV